MKNILNVHLKNKFLNPYFRGTTTDVSDIWLIRLGFLSVFIEYLCPDEGLNFKINLR